MHESYEDFPKGSGNNGLNRCYSCRSRDGIISTLHLQAGTVRKEHFDLYVMYVVVLYILVVLLFEHPS